MAPRRAAGPKTAATAVADATTVENAELSDLLILRRQWKWAAFCQFFHTFNSLFNMPDVSISDIEDDLTNAGVAVLPRIMFRLLAVLTQDRKMTINTWQTVLRRQYARRDPDANPLAPEPLERSPSPSPSPSPPAELQDSADVPDGIADQPGSRAPTDPPTSSPPDGSVPPPDDTGTEHTKLVIRGDATEVEDPRPQDWLDLPMLAKLDTMHQLTEWQFQNVHRFRTTMRSDDEDASWRIEPIGYDSKANAYWLIAENRLWIQRSPPNPNSNRKRKRSSASAHSQRKRVEISRIRNERTRKPRQSEKKTPASSRSSSRIASAPTNTPSGTRAAKLKANAKLDVQARELAAFQRAAASRALGTRTSSRLRGSNGDDEEWQQIPDDWLDGDGSRRASASARTRSNRPSRAASALSTPLTRSNAASPPHSTGLESDDESELTELSDEDAEGSEENADFEDGETIEDEAPAKDQTPPPETPSDFVEWETVCVTLVEWEQIAERFKNATHYAEKALHKVLSTIIVPAVSEELREIERRRRLEEAVYSRKRSSRIMVKENQREEARLAEIQRQEEEKEMARTKRAEARQQKEEEARLKREQAREQRRLEREARELARQQQVEKEDADEDRPIDVVSNIPPESTISSAPVKAATKLKKSTGSSRASIPPSKSVKQSSAPRPQPRPTNGAHAPAMYGPVHTHTPTWPPAVVAHPSLGNQSPHTWSYAGVQPQARGTAIQPYGVSSGSDAGSFRPNIQAYSRTTYGQPGAYPSPSHSPPMMPPPGHQFNGVHPDFPRAQPQTIPYGYGSPSTQAPGYYAPQQHAYAKDMNGFPGNPNPYMQQSGQLNPSPSMIQMLPDSGTNSMVLPIPRGYGQAAPGVDYNSSPSIAWNGRQQAYPAPGDTNGVPHTLNGYPYAQYTQNLPM